MVALKRGKVVVARNKQLIAGAPLLVRKVHRAQAADDAQSQQQVLQLARHALRGGRIEEAAAVAVNVAITLPHAADEQRNLCVGEGKDRSRDFLGACVLAQDIELALPMP